ncbi:MAG: hypothetical protein AAB425_15535 [Bdellovibrionota bacterium]
MLLCIGFGVAPTRADDPIPVEKLQGTDLRDVIRYQKKADSRWAVELKNELAGHPEKYFTSESVTFPIDGVWQSAIEHTDVVFNVELAAPPTLISSDAVQSTVEYKVTAMFHATKDKIGYVFRKMTAQISTPLVDKEKPAMIVAVTLGELIPLEKTSFLATINLDDRKIVLVACNNGITRVTLKLSVIDITILNMQITVILRENFLKNKIICFKSFFNSRFFIYYSLIKISPMS